MVIKTVLICLSLMFKSIFQLKMKLKHFFSREIGPDLAELEKVVPIPQAEEDRKGQSSRLVLPGPLSLHACSAVMPRQSWIQVTLFDIPSPKRTVVFESQREIAHTQSKGPY